VAGTTVASTRIASGPGATIEQDHRTVNRRRHDDHRSRVGPVANRSGVVSDCRLMFSPISTRSTPAAPSATSPVPELSLHQRG
jgi:hypothetical protein